MIAKDEGGRLCRRTRSRMSSSGRPAVASRWFNSGVAFAAFRQQGDKLILTHTEVPAAYGGLELASLLVDGLFQQARGFGRQVVPACSFVTDWARRHPEFADVVASR